MIATTCGYIGRSLIFHQLRHLRLGDLLLNSCAVFLSWRWGLDPCEAGGVVINITGAGFHPTDASKHLVIVSETRGEGFFFHGKFWRGWHHLHVDNVAFFPDG